MNAVGSRKLSAITQGAVINPSAREVAEVLKVLLRRIWFAPPETPVEDPHKWRNLIATSCLGGRAPEEAWNRLLSELHELLIFVRSDLAELGAGQTVRSPTTC